MTAEAPPVAAVEESSKDTTPKTGYQGATYYFCSEDCRAAFLKKPDMYLSKSESK